MNQKTEDAASEKEELQKLYVEKLVELRVEEELKRHYGGLFKRITALSEKNVELLGNMTKNMTQFEKKLEAIEAKIGATEAQVKELYQRVFGKQWEKYTA